MAGPPILGSLAFAAGDGLVFSTGLIGGRVSVRGPLSADAITLAVGLRFGPGSRLWLNPATDGQVGVFLPGDACDVILGEKSLYLAISLCRRKLEEAAAHEGLVLDRRIISRTGVQSRPIRRDSLVRLRRDVSRLHCRCPSVGGERIGVSALRTLVAHCARWSGDCPDGRDPVGRSRIVHRARDFIGANLMGPISLGALAVATGTSRRTLARAFLEVLEESPARYVRRLRLHRIRHDLVHDAMLVRTADEIATSWGLGEFGRMAGWYRELFGEYPGDTIEKRRHREVLI